MKIKQSLHTLHIALLSCLMLSVIACQTNEHKQQEPSLKRLTNQPMALIPMPNEIAIYEGQTPLFPRFCVNNMPDSLTSGFKLFKKNYSLQVYKWRRVYKKFFTGIPHLKDTCLNITFLRDSTQAPEGYHLALRDDIKIKYKTSKGAFYALRTLEQLVEHEMIDGVNGYFHLPWMDIQDAPRFSYRGAHLDVVRHFIPLEDVRKFIDVLSYYKLNKFHFHLTDDQGWRMEIKRYPKLQTIASKRRETLIGKPGPNARYDHKPHGGYYTQAALKQLVEYAATRGVEIIPEIELPGHSRALLAAYPELSCSGKRLPVATRWGVFDQVLCPTPKTLEFLKGVLDEVTQVFPSRYVHIGGDECPTKSWEESSFCRALMKEKGMKDPREIEGYFVHEIADYLQQKGKTVIGWDEILDSPIPQDAIIMAWRGVNRGIIAAKKGHRTIMTPGEYCYLDHYQSLSDSEPLAIGGYTSLAKTYSFDPAPDSLSPDVRRMFIGLQGNIWTEYLKDLDAVSYMAFPRIIALAEVGWTEKENKDYSHFVQSIVDHLSHLRKAGMHYSEAFKVPTYTTENKQSYTYVSLHSPFKLGRLKYWANRETSERLGEVYQAPIVITDSMYIKVKYFPTDRNASQEYKLVCAEHAATGLHLELDTKPDLSHKNSDADYLLNGIVGKTGRWRYNQEWLEFGPEGCSGTIDMLDTLPHRQILWHFGYEPKRNVWPPGQVHVSVGIDKNALQSVEPLSIKKKRSGKEMIYTLTLPDQPFRYLHIQALPKKVNQRTPRLLCGEIEVGWH